MPGTDEGFITNPSFIHWCDCASGLLWLYGVAGCGKTTLTSRIIDHLIDKSNSGENSRTAYWYFQFSNSNTQNITDVLRSLIRQLATKLLPESMENLWGTHGTRGSEPSMPELMMVLTELISCSSKDLYLVLDALDECPLDIRSFPFVDDVLKMCKSILITVIDGDAGDTIKLAHFSVKEFLILEDSSQKSTQWYKFATRLAHRLITAEIFECLFDDAKSPHSLVLQEYAQSYWPRHLEECDMFHECTSVRSKIDSLFSQEARQRILQSIVSRYSDLLLMILVHRQGNIPNLVNWLLHHIRTVDEDLIGVVALTPCAYEVTRFFLSTVSSDPDIIEHTAPEVYRRLLIWISSDSHAPLLREFSALVAFDCHPSVTEVGISLRQTVIGASITADTRDEVLSLLIDQSSISSPLQESTVSLIAEFSSLQLFSALLHKLWDKVSITKLVLKAIARNTQISWPYFQRLILGLYAAGFPLSDDIAEFIASDSAYNQLRWPMHLHTMAQDVLSGDRLRDIFLSDSYQVVRFRSTL